MNKERPLCRSSNRESPSQHGGRPRLKLGRQVASPAIQAESSVSVKQKPQPVAGPAEAKVEYGPEGARVFRPNAQRESIKRAAEAASPNPARARRHLNGKARVAAGAKAFANLTIWLTGPLSQGSAAGAPTFRPNIPFKPPLTAANYRDSRDSAEPPNWGVSTAAAAPIQCSSGGVVSSHCHASMRRPR
jgi:hypothetical protein